MSAICERSSGEITTPFANGSVLRSGPLPMPTTSSGTRRPERVITVTREPVEVSSASARRAPSRISPALSGMRPSVTVQPTEPFRSVKALAFDGPALDVEIGVVDQRHGGDLRIVDQAPDGRWLHVVEERVRDPAPALRMHREPIDAGGPDEDGDDPRHPDDCSRERGAGGKRTAATAGVEGEARPEHDGGRCAAPSQPRRERTRSGCTRGASTRLARERGDGEEREGDDDRAHQEERDVGGPARMGLAARGAPRRSEPGKRAARARAPRRCRARRRAPTSPGAPAAPVTGSRRAR